jgi:hypothetical protein
VKARFLEDGRLIVGGFASAHEGNRRTDELTSKEAIMWLISRVATFLFQVFATQFIAMLQEDVALSKRMELAADFCCIVQVMIRGLHYTSY